MQERPAKLKRLTRLLAQSFGSTRGGRRSILDDVVEARSQIISGSRRRCPRLWRRPSPFVPLGLESVVGRRSLGNFVDEGSAVCAHLWRFRTDVIFFCCASSLLGAPHSKEVLCRTVMVND